MAPITLYSSPTTILLEYLLKLTREYQLDHKRLTAVEFLRMLVKEGNNGAHLTELCFTLFHCYYRNVFRDITQESLAELRQKFRSAADKSIVIVPGESPSRVPILLKYFFGDGTNHFTFDENDTKEIEFVEITISGLTSFYDSKKEKEIIQAYILSKVPFLPTSSFYILDFHSSNESYRFFKELFPDIEKINEETLPGIIPDAEHFDARCVDAHYVTRENTSIFTTNLLHCNLSTLFIILRMTKSLSDVHSLNARYDSLIKQMFLPLFLIKDGFFTITYIDQNGKTATMTDSKLMCRHDWSEDLFEKFSIVNIRMLLLIVPKSVLIARASSNAKVLGKRTRQEVDTRQSDYLYFKKLPTVVKVYPFYIKHVSSP